MAWRSLWQFCTIFERMWGWVSGPLDRLLDRFWIWKWSWEGISIAYNTGTGFYWTALFVNPWIHTKTTPIPMIIGPWHWTDFESGNCFEKVLPLATIVVQGFLDQLYSLTPEGPIYMKSPYPHIGRTGPLARPLDRYCIVRPCIDFNGTTYHLKLIGQLLVCNRYKTGTDC
jgi:hypothetical protein